MKKVYIAGKITNNPKYIEEFKEAEEILKKLGYAVINPVKNLGFSYKDYIDMGLCELMKCDCICLLDNYEASTGAMLEYYYAKIIGMKIIHFSDICNKSKKLDRWGLEVKDVLTSEKGIIITAQLPSDKSFSDLYAMFGGITNDMD